MLFMNVIEASCTTPPSASRSAPGARPQSTFSGKVVGKVVGVFFLTFPPLLTDPTAREREGERESERVP